MKRLVIALSLLIFPLVLNAQSLADLNLSDCNVRLIFASIWNNSPSLAETEKAAWIVPNPKGGYEPVKWFHSPQRGKQEWSGEMPDDIVALAHTHPDHRDPKPSQPDILLARKINVPLYTLSRKGIWKVTSNGMVTEEVGRSWFEDTIRTCGTHLK